MIKNIISAALASFAIVAPSAASSWTDVNSLTSLIKQTGTQVQERKCPDNIQGYYHLDPANKIDLLVVCKNNVDMTDPDSVWEVVAHEATHIMQACNAGPVVKNTYVPRILRELQETAPHYYATLQGYRGDHKRRELEAFWMELRTPEVVNKWISDFCFED